jgi:L-alanine-DL-glutamate epimerase-like enolase superfamily enzyme
MKIKNVKVLLVEGGPTPPEGLFEENPPISGFGGRIAEEPKNMVQPYVKLITDEEINDLSPGFPSRVAPFIIRDLLKPVLIGKDPRKYEALWIQMRRRVRHGRRGRGDAGCRSCRFSYLGHYW